MWRDSRNRLPQCCLRAGPSSDLLPGCRLETNTKQLPPLQKQASGRFRLCRQAVLCVGQAVTVTHRWEEGQLDVEVNQFITNAPPSSCSRAEHAPRVKTVFVLKRPEMMTQKCLVLPLPSPETPSRKNKNKMEKRKRSIDDLDRGQNGRRPPAAVGLPGLAARDRQGKRLKQGAHTEDGWWWSTMDRTPPRLIVEQRRGAFPSPGLPIRPIRARSNPPRG